MAVAFDGGDPRLTAYLALGIGLMLAVAYVGWTAGEYDALRRQGRQQ